MIKVPICSLPSILSSRAFNVQDLPLSGRIAWNLLSAPAWLGAACRPRRVDSPASGLSPDSRRVARQVAHVERALRCTISRALRRASRALRRDHGLFDVFRPASGVLEILLQPVVDDRLDDALTSLDTSLPPGCESNLCRGA